MERRRIIRTDIAASAVVHLSLVALIILIGLYPLPFFSAMETSVTSLAQHVGQSQVLGLR